MVDREEFSEWLSRQIKEQGITQSELARSAGVSRAAIHKAINRLNKRPDPDTCIGIARALKKSPVTVFRTAGLLPPETELPEWEEFRVILDELSEEGRAELLAIAKVKLAFEERGKASIR